ncbi:MAG: DUF5320 domain-containing protein [Methanohalobium sp.]|uniref:DUF5320 domain-containing protein n=1 Tax=Methanohalobium sp. TaxID=2837493 RepID=UPI00397D13FF
MPGGDRTGPIGSGPLTGRGAGYCAGFDAPGFANNVPVGRGLARGRGFAFYRRGMGLGSARGNGFGFRSNSNPTPGPGQYVENTGFERDVETSIRSLEQEQRMLREELDNINKKLGELKSK